MKASLDMRYLGQAFELSVDVDFGRDDMAVIEAAFRGVYAARYGEAMEGPTEIVSYRLAAWGLTDKPVLPDPESTAAVETVRDVVFDGASYPTVVLHRAAMPVGRDFEGPVIMEEDGASTVVPPGWRVQRDALGILVLARS